MALAISTTTMPPSLVAVLSLKSAQISSGTVTTDQEHKLKGAYRSSS
jgi:hypothetical protein